MPSDNRLGLALDAVAPRIATFRSAVIAAHERVRGLLGAGGGPVRASLELGAFAAGRIDAGRFAGLASGHHILDGAARARLSRASDILRTLSEVNAESFVITIPPGGRLRFNVASALGNLGCAFGAATVADLIRTGRYRPAEHDRMLEACGFENWNRAERLLAPPLVVRVAGADLRAGVLADFLDGNMHLVLLVEGECAPASLARLITPGTLVLQTSDGAGLDSFASYRGPAVAALVPPTAARFLHDPAGGKSAWQRLRIWSSPTSPPRRSINGMSARQQLEDLLQLEALAEQPSLGERRIEDMVPAGGGDATERLASWLLAASGLPEA